MTRGLTFWLMVANKEGLGKSARVQRRTFEHESKRKIEHKTNRKHRAAVDNSGGSETIAYEQRASPALSKPVKSN